MTHLDATTSAYEDVLWLHVAVYDAVGVQVVQRLHELACHAAHHALRQAPVVLQDVEQLACRQSMASAV